MEFTRNTKNRKYAITGHLFEDIDCEQAAYFLGLLLADGSNVYVPNRHINIVLQKVDLPIIEELRNFTGYLGPIKDVRTKYRGLTIHSAELSRNLDKWGMVANKTFILEQIPDIPDNLMHHFIRGYFDGDGSISKVIRGDRVNPKPRLKFNIVGNLSFLEGIQQVLIDKCGVSKVKMYPSKNGKTYFLDYVGNVNCKKIYEYMYNSATTFLDRKKNKFEEVIYGVHS